MTEVEASIEQATAQPQEEAPAIPIAQASLPLAALPLPPGLQIAHAPILAAVPGLVQAAEPVPESAQVPSNQEGTEPADEAGPLPEAPKDHQQMPEGEQQEQKEGEQPDGGPKPEDAENPAIPTSQQVRCLRACFTTGSTSSRS